MNAKQRRRYRRAPESYWARVCAAIAERERAYIEHGVTRAPDWTDSTGYTHTGEVTYRLVPRK